MAMDSFVGGDDGPWAITRIDAITGPGLPMAPRLRVAAAPVDGGPGDRWTLHGAASHARYATRAELAALSERQAPPGRPEATTAVLIPIRKSAAWWALAQDERRALFEESSHHARIGMDYLPAIARKLYHARDLGGPFDFLTWFEFAPRHEPDFDRLLARLRATAEWTFVEREVEVRLARG